MNDTMMALQADLQELDSLRPPQAVNRRGFMMTSLGAGFAAAAGPISAQTIIKTDTQGLDTGETKLATKNGSIPAYYAKPVGKSALPTVLVVQEIFGVHEYIKDVCRRFAKEGFLAVAPDLFARVGDASKVTDIPTLMRDYVAKAPDAQVLADLDLTAAWAEKNGGQAGKLGVTGFCWGGRIVWMYAAHRPELTAGVAWYGNVAAARVPGDKSVIEVAPQIKAPVLGLYGGADTGIPVESVERLREALKVSGNTRSEIIVYPEMPHAFHADYRPSYRKEAADDGWKRCIAWFKKNRLV